MAASNLATDLKMPAVLAQGAPFKIADTVTKMAIGTDSPQSAV